MASNRKMNDWLGRLYWHKSDTTETLDQKVYLVGNMMIPAIAISIDLVLVLYIGAVHLFFLITPLLATMIVTAVLLWMIKRGINWFLHFYYGGYIILCGILVMKLGGLPNSCGIWGGAFICFMHAVAIKDIRILIINALIYCLCLGILVFLYPGLTPAEGWTPRFNNFFLTVNEVWMCLYLVKSFYDSIVIKTSEAKAKSDHLQELDLLKSKLYANIAHEFRTPLTLIKGHAGEISELEDRQDRTRAESIVRNSDKILFLINQMLNLSKVEEGQVSLKYEQSDLVAFVRYIVNSYQGYADSRKIKVHFLPQCSEVRMDLDPEKLEESLSNLLSNAIKYTCQGGHVYVSIRVLEPVVTGKEQVEISVRDTGIGIPEDRLDRIFDRFYRVEDKKYPYQEGTGIGLTLVSEYIKLMKGSIRVTSKPGEGSEFTLQLPVTHEAEITDAVPSGGTKVVENLCVEEDFTENGSKDPHPSLLIIEDNRELVGYLSGILGSAYRLLTAVNGVLGIARAIEEVPDIILSDVMMPGKDGYQVCRELKNDFRTNHIPIVLLTARADTASRITGMQQGADAYLAKPFNKRELLVCLDNILLQRETVRLKFQTDIFSKRTYDQDSGLNVDFLSRVIRSLENNYDKDDYGIKNLYQDMKVSRVQLHRKITALTGQSASNFIRSFRLQKACRLLLETEKNVTDICYEVGFEDANYFSKAFHLEFGQTASEWRKSFRHQLKQSC